MKEQVKKILREFFWEVRAFPPNTKIDIESKFDELAAQILALLSPKGENPPVLSGQIRDIIEREYATPPIISGKCWEERATVGIAELLEPLIQQAKEEVAREIFEEIGKRLSDGIVLYVISKEDWQSLKSKYLPIEINETQELADLRHNASDDTIG